MAGIFMPVLCFLFQYFYVYFCVECLYLLCDFECVWSRGGVLEGVSLSDEALDFWGEVRVMGFPAAFGDMCFVCVLYYVVKLFDCGVDVSDGCTVHEFHVLFCF